MIKEMKSKYVIDLYTKLESLGIKIWIDGGWAVDALLGKTTRNHSDLDIAVEAKNLEKMRNYLENLGYMELERDEDKKWDFVLTDNKGHEIDVHSFSFNDNGDVIEEKNEWAGYRKNSLSGKGTINRVAVRCVNLEHLLRTHDGTKRKLKEKDYKDILELTKKFKS